MISHQAIYRFIYHRVADLMLFRQSSNILLIVHERTSRLTKIFRQPNRSAPTARDNLARLLDPIPANLRRTLIIDNRTENALHYELHKATFFCDVHAPWQKGGIENPIGRLRRFLPRLQTPSELFTKILNPAALETGLHRKKNSGGTTKNRGRSPGDAPPQACPIVTVTRSIKSYPSS